MDEVMLGAGVDAIAPDGSEVRVLVAGEGGSMAHFTLGAGEVSVAVAHRTLEELWYVLAGEGRMWRRARGDDGPGRTIEVRAGTSLRIPPRTYFQLRADRGTLRAVGVTMPPWPGGGDLSGRGEVDVADGPWAPTVRPGLDPG